MSNVVSLKAYRDAKAKPVTIDDIAKLWIAYWFMLTGIKII